MSPALAGVHAEDGNNNFSQVRRKDNQNIRRVTLHQFALNSSAFSLPLVNSVISGPDLRNLEVCRK